MRGWTSRKTIVFGSILAVFWMVIIPNVNAIEFNVAKSNFKDIIQNNDYNLSRLINNNIFEKFKIYNSDGNISFNITTFLIGIVVTVFLYGWFSPEFIKSMLLTSMGKIIWNSVAIISPYIGISYISVIISDEIYEEYTDILQPFIAILELIHLKFLLNPEIFGLILDYSTPFMDMIWILMRFFSIFKLIFSIAEILKLINFFDKPLSTLSNLQSIIYIQLPNYKFIN